nr:hypothetical protein [Clostridia bacterium]
MKKRQAAYAGMPLGVQYFIWISLSTAAVLMLMVLQNYRATSRALEAEYVSQATRIVEKNNQLLDAHYDSVVSLLLHYGAQAQEYLALSDTERLRTLHTLEANNATLISRAYIIAPDNRVVTARQTLY